MSITFDTWTAVNKKNYLGVTGHYVRNYELKACHLAFLESSESHTSADLVELLQSQVTNLYPHVKIICCVTDSAANMIKTAKDLGIRHLPCFLHRVQTTVNKAIARVSKYFINEGVLDTKFDDLEEIDEADEYVSHLFLF